MPLPDSQPLRDKTCLITGGARRLGRASALALAQAGADVAITFRNSAREAQRTVIDLSGLGVRSFALFGVKSRSHSGSGFSRLIVGGIRLLWTDSALITASTPPLAPSKCPSSLLVELIATFRA